MGKVPFSLSPRFRPMVQRGVDLASLDVAYFTSLSYYIVLLFASRGPFSLFFREETVDETEAMRRQLNPAMGATGGFDAAAQEKSRRNFPSLFPRKQQNQQFLKKRKRPIARLHRAPPTIPAQQLQHRQLTMTKKEATATTAAAEVDRPKKKEEPKKHSREEEEEVAAADARPDARPMHDPSLPAGVVEEGKIYFLYRPRVVKAGTDTHVSNLDEVARTFVLLVPLAASDKAVGEGREALEAAEAASPTQCRPLNRLFVLPKKSLPGAEGPGEARLLINVGVSDDVPSLTLGLHASKYKTKTRGAREAPAARLAAAGSYVLVAPTAGPQMRARRLAAAAAAEEKEREEAAEEAGEKQPEKKKARRSVGGGAAAGEEAEAATDAGKRRGRPASSSRLLWLLEAPRQGGGPAARMLGLPRRGAFGVKVKGPLGDRGGGGGGGMAPPPPDPETLPGPTRARLEAARTKWVNVDTHACLDFKGAQLLLIAQDPYGGGTTGPGAPDEQEAGGAERDQAAIGEEAGPEVAAALAGLVAGDERRLEEDARRHGEGLDAALRRALMAELEGYGEEEGGDDEEEEEGDGEEDEAARWAAHHEEAERQLGAHEREEAAERGEAQAEAAAEGAPPEGSLVLEPALTGAVL